MSIKSWLITRLMARLMAASQAAPEEHDVYIPVTIKELIQPVPGCWVRVATWDGQRHQQLDVTVQFENEQGQSYTSGDGSLAFNDVRGQWVLAARSTAQNCDVVFEQFFVKTLKVLNGDESAWLALYAGRLG